MLKYWDRLRSTFWFVPAAMASLAVLLALSAIALDQAFAKDWLKRRGGSYSADAEGASLLLGTVAGSMIAIAGTVFSMTLVALSLASSQLGPRLLDTIAQIAGQGQHAEDAACLQRHATMIVRGAREAVPEAEDRAAVEDGFAAATRALQALHD